MNTYVVNFTDVTTSPIYVEEQSVDNTSTDVSLFGYIRLKYGEELQENLLHLLENFASPEDSMNPGNPDFSKTVGNLLETPVVGQFWYNTSAKILNRWDGTQWAPLRTTDDVAANWGSIGNGQQLPKPVSQHTGRVFEYDECIWSIAPAIYESYFKSMTCETDPVDSTVKIEYEFADSTVISGTVNYLIIGMRGNKNLGSSPVVPPGVTPTITPTNHITPSVTPTMTPTPTITPTITPASSFDIMGVNTRLYTSPSPGDPGGPGPGGVDYKLYDTCEIVTGSTPTSSYNNNTLYTDVQQSYYVSLQGIGGGVPPYTVNFRWIIVSNVRGWWNDDGNPYAKFDLAPHMSYEIKYYGGTGTDTDYLRANITSASLPRIKITPVFNDPQWFNNRHSYYINYGISGRIILTDSVGTTQSWWMPQHPTEAGGYNLHDEIPWSHHVSYGHYANCYECPDCR